MCCIYDCLDAQHMPKYQRKLTHQRSTDQDGYKLYDCNTNKVIRSQDVIFEEGTGHRTISEEQNNDEFDIFPINDPQSNDNAQEATRHLLHEINPIAP